MLGKKYTKIKMTLCNLTSYYEFIFITTKVPEVVPGGGREGQEG